MKFQVSEASPQTNKRCVVTKSLRLSLPEGSRHPRGVPSSEMLDQSGKQLLTGKCLR